MDDIKFTPGGIYRDTGIRTIFKESDPERTKPQEILRAFTLRLRTWVPEDMERWKNIRQAASMGLGQITREEISRSEKDNGWDVLAIGYIKEVMLPADAVTFRNHVARMAIAALNGVSEKEETDAKEHPGDQIGTHP